MSKPTPDAHGVPTHPSYGWVQGSHAGQGRTHASQTSNSQSRGHPTDSGQAPLSSFHATSTPGSHQALCLWLPTFELRLELMRSPELGTTSVALLSSGESVRRTVWQVSERAWEAGVRPEQIVSQAVSLCPSLTLLEPDPAHPRYVQTVWGAGYRFRSGE